MLEIPSREIGHGNQTTLPPSCPKGKKSHNCFINGSCFCSSLMVLVFAFAQVAVAICGRSSFEYIVSKKSEILLSLSYFSKYALKSQWRITVLFSSERVYHRFGR